MLSYILGLIQAFERDHGFRPQLVYLNPQHLQALLAECPDLALDEFLSKIGFRIALRSDNELPHPKIAWLPPIRPYVVARMRSRGRLSRYKGIKPSNRIGA